MRHLDPLALFHLVVAHETNTKQCQFDILAGIASLLFTAIEGIHLFAKETLPPGKRRGLDVIALPRTMIDCLGLDRRHHHWRTARVHGARHYGDGVELVIGVVP